MDKADNLLIRPLKAEEQGILIDLLYQAIYQPDKENPIPRSVLQMPEIAVYITNFGADKDDACFVAEQQNRIIGGVWVRILSGSIKGFGNVDKHTPEFAISLFEPYRNRGIGSLLMKRMIAHLKEKQYKQASLSVNKENYALKLYQKLGFEIIRENEDDYLMLLNLT